MQFQIEIVFLKERFFVVIFFWKGTNSFNIEKVPHV
jgi:hypothetical protein